MSSAAVGVQAITKRDAPLATYVHCSGHSCSLPPICNVLDMMKKLLQVFPEQSQEEWTVGSCSKGRYYRSNKTQSSH